MIQRFLTWLKADLFGYRYWSVIESQNNACFEKWGIRESRTKPSTNLRPYRRYPSGVMGPYRTLDKVKKLSARAEKSNNSAVMGDWCR